MTEIAPRPTPPAGSGNDARSHEGTRGQQGAETGPGNFVEELVKEDVRLGKNGGRVHAGFPRSRTATSTSATPSRSA